LTGGGVLIPRGADRSKLWPMRWIDYGNDIDPSMHP